MPDDQAPALTPAEGVLARPKTAKRARAVAKKYGMSIYPVGAPLPQPFVDAVHALEAELKLKLWVLIQGGDDDWDDIGRPVYEGFRCEKALIKGRVGLLLHSPGGRAAYAYQIARLFQRRTDDFYTVVPLYAKSAATLIAIAGKEIIMGMESELGPLDVQIYDRDKDAYDSALNAVQSLERLNAYALTAFDQAMGLFMARTRKKPDALMPLALEYATSIVKPLVDKIDTIELTRKSRELKVAEDYAQRLMRANYTRTEYAKIALSLVERYSSHDFVIDRMEAGSEGASAGKLLNLGLHTAVPSATTEKLFDSLVEYLEGVTAIGRVIEVKP